MIASRSALTSGERGFSSRRCSATRCSSPFEIAASASQSSQLEPSRSRASRYASRAAADRACLDSPRINQGADAHGAKRRASARCPPPFLPPRRALRERAEWAYASSQTRRYGQQQRNCRKEPARHRRPQLIAPCSGDECDSNQQRRQCDSEQLPVPVDARVREPGDVPAEGHRDDGRPAGAHGRNDRYEQGQDEQGETDDPELTQCLYVEAVCIAHVQADRAGSATTASTFQRPLQRGVRCSRPRPRARSQLCRSQRSRTGARRDRCCRRAPGRESPPTRSASRGRSPFVHAADPSLPARRAPLPQTPVGLPRVLQAALCEAPACATAAEPAARARAATRGRVRLGRLSQSQSIVLSPSARVPATTATARTALSRARREQLEPARVERNRGDHARMIAIHAPAEREIDGDVITVRVAALVPSPQRSAAGGNTDARKTPDGRERSRARSVRHRLQSR